MRLVRGQELFNELSQRPQEGAVAVPACMCALFVCSAEAEEA